MSYAIEIDNIRKEFTSSKYLIMNRKAVHALKGVTFNVREGEVFGLLGPNGSGKTTLIRILCGLVRPTAGSAKVFGMDIEKEILKIRERIALLPQEAS
ncbi:MAG: ATP-binding cassette domain-containing protein, partial [Candidatus Hodarchaeales archaeon]